MAIIDRRFHWSGEQRQIDWPVRYCAGWRLHDRGPLGEIRRNQNVLGMFVFSHAEDTVSDSSLA